MQPALALRSVVSTGVLAEGTFGVSTANLAFVLRILRDQMYTNKVLAVLREYSTNAWDEHKEAGISDKPFKVTLPTVWDSALIIRDYGRGLREGAPNEEEDVIEALGPSVFSTYIKYGASSKRTSNEAHGMLGLGSKSAFAYNDTFTVTSFHGGTKKVYVAVLDATDVGKLSKLHEGTTEETGVEIRIPVNPIHVSDFTREAKSLFTFFTPRPDININLDPLPKEMTEMGTISRTVLGSLGRWTAVMGCVPYKLTFEQLSDQLATRGLNKIANSLFGVLRFKIGEVDISPSRETLEFTDRTKNAVVDRLQELVDTLTKEKAVELRAVSNGWRKRLEVIGYSLFSGLTLPHDLEKYSQSTVPLYTWEKIPVVAGTETVVEDVLVDPNDEEEMLEPSPGKGYQRSVHTFTLRKTEKRCRSRGNRKNLYSYNESPDIEVNAKTQLVIRDVDKPVQRFDIDLEHNNTYRFVIPRAGFSIAEVTAELDQALLNQSLDGVSIRLLSSFPKKEVQNAAWCDPKHRNRFFTLKGAGAGSYTHGSSQDWELAEDLPEKDDPVVIISYFKVVGDGPDVPTIVHQTTLLRRAGVVIPDIYGVKTLDKKPISSGEYGTPYSTWIAKAFTQLLQRNQALRAELENVAWTLRNEQWWTSQSSMEVLTTEFGVIHPLTQFHRKVLEASSALNVMKQGRRQLLNELFQWSKLMKWRYTAETQLQRLHRRYPLLNPDVTDGLRHVVYTVDKGIQVERRAAWIHYIKTIDSMLLNSPPIKEETE